jgi:tetratricopeptide (TPR) repeat protein
MSQLPNIEAYNLVLQGNYFFDRLDSVNVVRSIELYQKAIDLDPLFEKAWAMLARSYSRMAWFNFMDQNEGYEKARAASMKAIEINSNSVDGLRALGNVKQYHDLDWARAEADFQRALEIEPLTRPGVGGDSGFSKEKNHPFLLRLWLRQAGAQGFGWQVAFHINLQIL